MSTHDRYYQLGSRDKLFNQIDELKEELALCCEIREGTTVGEQNLVRWVEMKEEIATLRSEVKLLRDALNDVRTPIEFWISCKTEFGSAYSALLNIITKALAATEQWRILEPNEQVEEGDRILLVGGTWIVAGKTESTWLARDYVEVKRKALAATEPTPQKPTTGETA